MSEPPSKPPPAKAPSKDAKAERLAKALRDNLRRRKAAPQPSGRDEDGAGDP